MMDIKDEEKIIPDADNFKYYPNYDWHLPSGSSVLHTENDSDNDFDSAKLPIILNGTFFKILQSEADDLIGTHNVIASCVKCEPELVKIKGSRRSSSNFISHLKRRHGQKTFDEYQDYKRRCHLSKRTDPNVRNIPRVIVYKQNESEKTCIEKIVKFVMHASVPLKVIENPYFRDLFDGIQPLTVPSQYQVECEINRLYTNHVEDIKKMLNSAVYVCTTADIWSSRKRSYLVVTAHWLTSNDLTRQSVALACRRIKGVHTSDRINEMIQEIHLEYKIIKKQLIATVTDNESNFVNAFEAFGINKAVIVCENEKETLEEISDSSEDDNDEDTSNCNETWTKSLPIHFECSSHTLSLCVTFDLKHTLFEDVNLRRFHEEIMAKCNVLWTFSQRSKTTEILKNVLGHTLSRPQETRWNSLYDALKQIWELKDKMATLITKLNITNPLTEQEFLYLAEYLKCTEPVANALDILQSEENIYFGILLPCILSLQRKLQTLRSNSWVYCQPLANFLYESVMNRFQNLLAFDTPYSETAIIAALTYPRFKNRWFSLISSELHPRLLDLLKREVASENEKTKNIAIKADPGQSHKNDDFFDFPTSNKDISGENFLPTGEFEVLKYLSDPDGQLNCLDKYPNVRKLFIKFNTPIPSSAPVERVFSYQTIFNLLNSHKMSDSVFEKRIILRSVLNRN